MSKLADRRGSLAGLVQGFMGTKNTPNGRRYGGGCPPPYRGGGGVEGYKICKKIVRKNPPISPHFFRILANFFYQDSIVFLMNLCDLNDQIIFFL